MSRHYDTIDLKITPDSNIRYHPGNYPGVGYGKLSLKELTLYITIPYTDNSYRRLYTLKYTDRTYFRYCAVVDLTQKSPCLVQTSASTLCHLLTTILATCP